MEFCFPGLTSPHGQRSLAGYSQNPTLMAGHPHRGLCINQSGTGSVSASGFFYLYKAATCGDLDEWDGVGWERGPRGRPFSRGSS